MNRGGLLLVSAAVLACTACLGDQGKLEIRSTSNGLKAGSEPVPFRIAEARGHLALGNVALALEGFRKAAREDPASAEAQAGIADCYDRIGRFDLSRRHYEMALAIAPRDQGLLAAFAASLDRQGLAAEAASVRREITVLASAPIPQPAAEAVPLPATVVARQETGIAASPRPAEPAAPAIAAPAPVRTAVADPAPAELAAPAPVGRSVTIALPPPRPADPSRAEAAAPRARPVVPVGRSVTIALPPPRPVRSAVASRQPRIERLSLTEVALITGEGPRWRRPETQSLKMAAQTALAKPGPLRLLNAARIHRLAARTRTYLGRSGWRNVAIGDAAVVRSRSLIVYPQGARAEASKLSAKLGFAMAPRAGVRQLTVLLGRDAAGHPALR